MSYCVRRMPRGNVWDAFQLSYVGVALEQAARARTSEAWFENWWIPASRQQESVEERFTRLTTEWKTDTAWMSSVSEFATHPAYQSIIGMGADAVPLLLRELARAPDHWFWALRAISGIDPVPAEDRGKVEKMAEAWLKWGRVQGYDLP